MNFFPYKSNQFDHINWFLDSSLSLWKPLPLPPAIVSTHPNIFIINLLFANHHKSVTTYIANAIFFFFPF